MKRIQDASTSNKKMFADQHPNFQLEMQDSMEVPIKDKPIKVRIKNTIEME